MTSPLFTQKHYEYLIDALRTQKINDAEIVEILCTIFVKDNPKFKPDLFRDSIIRQS
jgi:hypothetical protein